MASLPFPPGYQITDANGNPLPGALVYVYQAGTTTKVNLYSDYTLTTPLANPVVANSAGRPGPIYLVGGARIKVAVTTATGGGVFENDNVLIPVSDSATVPVASGGTGATTAANARTNLGAAAASDVTTVQSTLTTISGERAALPGGSFGDVAGLDLVTPEYIDDAEDFCVQRFYTTTVATTSVNAAIPVDTTVPQSSEGVEVFTTSFTPKYAASTLEITAHFSAAALGADAYLVGAIFAGGVSAIAADAVQNANASGARAQNLTVVARHAPGSVSPVTISARAGSSAGTITLNGFFGSVGGCWFRIRELVNTPIS